MSVKVLLLKDDVWEAKEQWGFINRLGLRPSYFMSCFYGPSRSFKDNKSQQFLKYGLHLKVYLIPIMFSHFILGQLSFLTFSWVYIVK